MAYTFSNEIISDLHKDARGYRPSQGFYEMWNESSDDTKQEVWDMLIEEMQIRDQEEMELQRKALVELRASLRSVMKLMKCDWKVALRVLANAEDIDLEQDFDYFLWNQGVGFDDRNKISKLYKEAA